MKKYTSACAFRTALELRLQRHAQEHGIDLQRLRQHVSFDRLLGGTKDIDLAIQEKKLFSEDSHERNKRPSCADGSIIPTVELIKKWQKIIFCDKAHQREQPLSAKLSLVSGWFLYPSDPDSMPQSVTKRIDKNHDSL